MSVQFVCDVCTYPSLNGTACDNPGCLANPTLSASHKARMAQQDQERRANRAADDARLAMKAKLRKAGFTSF